MDPKQHWQTLYETRRAAELSWFQPTPRLSLELIQRAAPGRAAEILDVGGGASMLVDGLLAAGYRRLTVLDLAAAGLAQARERLGPLSAQVAWHEADLLSASLPRAGFDLWHDRAVFHFLTAPAERSSYVAQLRRALRPGGHVLVAAFADDGPTRCSGLEVARYTPEALHAALGADFALVRSAREVHLTPRGAQQAFTYGLCRYEPRALPAGPAGTPGATHVG